LRRRQTADNQRPLVRPGQASAAADIATGNHVAPLIQYATMLAVNALPLLVVVRRIAINDARIDALFVGFVYGDFRPFDALTFHDVDHLHYQAVLLSTL
jgi:hypothetical protein